MPLLESGDLIQSQGPLLLMPQAVSESRTLLVTVLMAPRTRAMGVEVVELLMIQAAMVEAAL